MKLLVDVLSHETNFFYQICDFLYSHELAYFRSTCSGIRSINLVPLGRTNSNLAAHVAPDNRVYLHCLLEYAQLLACVARLNSRVRFLSPLVFESREHLLDFFETLADRDRSNTFYRVFWVSEAAVENFVSIPAVTRKLSVDTAASDTPVHDGIKMRMILKHVPRVGLAMGVELESGNTPSLTPPLVRVLGRVGARQVCLRAGFRTSDLLRETDGKGFWTDLVPVTAEPMGTDPGPSLCHERRVQVACVVELNDAWR